MEENPMKEAKSFDEAANTGSPSKPSIFGTPFTTASATRGEAPLDDEALQQPSMELNQKEEQVGQELTFALRNPFSLQSTTQEQNSVARENSIMNNTADTADTTTVAPYKDGFGDFFFEPFEKWYTPTITEGMSEEEKQDAMGITGSNAVPIVELDGFKRAGPFPYAKLPWEIREKIIRLLLQPVFSTYWKGDTMIEYTSFELDPLPDPHENLNYGAEDLYYHSEQAADRQTERMLYPGRQYPYDVTLYPTRRGCDGRVSLDLLFLRWLRRASYVSSSFRYDLARVLWHHTTICVGNESEEESMEENYWREDDKWFDNRGLSELDSLILERPAIKQGVRTLELCSGNMVLEDAYFNIHASEEDLKKFMYEEKSCLDGLDATEKWQVKKAFGVELKRVHDDNDEYDSDDELDPDYEDALFQYMLPLSLCDREPDTEEEKYLQERFEEFGNTEKPEEVEEIDDKEQSEELGEVEETEADHENAETVGAENLDEARGQVEPIKDDDTTPALADPEDGIDLRSADE